MSLTKQLSRERPEKAPLVRLARVRVYEDLRINTNKSGSDKSGHNGSVIS
jgi:hypothetical protein